jgi:hypothetical protein
MKKQILLPAILALLSLAAPSPVLAAKKEGKANKAEKKARNEAVRHFDTNGDGKLEGDEAEAARKSFAADPNGPAKSLDADQNGQLEEAEITGVQVKPKGEKKKKK